MTPHRKSSSVESPEGRSPWRRKREAEPVTAGGTPWCWRRVLEGAVVEIELPPSRKTTSAASGLLKVAVERDSYEAVFVGIRERSADLGALGSERASAFSSRPERTATISQSIAKLSRSPVAISEVNACRHWKIKSVVSPRDAGNAPGR